MYNPPTFLTKQVLLEIMNEFEWPELFKVEDEDCSIDGIKVRFPNCVLYFKEGFESEMSLYVAKKDSNKYWPSFQLIHYIFAPKIEKTESFKSPQLNNFFSPFASLLKVQYGLRDLCILIQTYLLSCLEGDFAIVDDFFEQHPNL